MIPATLATVLALLAAVHVYWAIGGAWGKASSLPEVGGRPAFIPSRGATLLVAAGLSFGALVALSRGHLAFSSRPGSLAHWFTLAFGLAFVLRAIGEFRLVGVFKRVRDTSFARRDTWLFSPLSLLLGVAFLWLAAQP